MGQGHRGGLLGYRHCPCLQETWQKCKDALTQDAVVLLTGKVSSRERDEEDPPIFLDDVESLEALPSSGRLAVQIELELDESGLGSLNEEAFRRARTFLDSHPGAAPVELKLGLDNGAPAPGSDPGRCEPTLQRRPSRRSGRSSERITSAL